MSLQRQHFLRSYLKTLTGALPTGPTRRRFLGQVSRSLISLPLIMSIAILGGGRGAGGNFLKVFGSGRSDERSGNLMTMFKW